MNGQIEDNEEIFLVASGSNEENSSISSGSSLNELDQIIGVIEDLLLGSAGDTDSDGGGIGRIQAEFMTAHMDKFDSSSSNVDDEENTLEQMDIFRRYSERMESYLMQELTGRIPAFSLETFGRLVTAAVASGSAANGTDQNNDDDMTFLSEDSEIFDILSSMTDYSAFKQLILAHKSGARLSLLDEGADPCRFSSDTRGNFGASINSMVIKKL